jgi:hypothetical protein
MGLKDIPKQFSIDSEEDLRIVLVSYFKELGILPEEFSFEDYFSITLGHTSLPVNRKSISGRSDILITRNGIPLLLIETKSPNETLSDKDNLQVLSYARLLQKMPPFAILTNGVETRVFDVVAGDKIDYDSLIASPWYKNGQKNKGVSEEIKNEAARFITSVCPETIDFFCKKQVEAALSDIKSTVEQNKKYIPEIYVERTELQNKFNGWLEGSGKIFAVVSPSGYGKTNFMCFESEKLGQNDFVLFYSASRLRENIFEAIREDFIWEFNREISIQHILARLNSIAQTADRYFFVVIDAIDEFPNSLKRMKLDLLKFSEIIDNFPRLRIIVSCKSFDWPRFIIDDAQNFNLLAEKVTPSCGEEKCEGSVPDYKKIGFYLEEFTEAELNEALEKYSTGYAIRGDFIYEIRETCKNPLMLRLISEIYSKSTVEMPRTITNIDLFNLYCNRKLSSFEFPEIGNKIICFIAKEMFEQNKRSISKEQLTGSVNWDGNMERTYSQLLRVGILYQSEFGDETVVGFEFYRLFMFLYLFKVKKLQKLPHDKQAIFILESLGSQIGFEVIDFYISISPQENIDEVLRIICVEDFHRFSQLMNNAYSLGNYRSNPIPQINILNFLKFYNLMKDLFFSTSEENKNLPLGILLFEGSSAVQFRKCTKKYPNLIILLNNNIAPHYLKGEWNQQIQEEIHPIGPLYLTGNPNLSGFPQKYAYEYLREEINKRFINESLDEKANPEILFERAQEILTGRPNIWLENDYLEPMKNYLELLGYSRFDEISTEEIKNIIPKIHRLINLIMAEQIRNPQNNGSSKSRLRELSRLLKDLCQLGQDTKLQQNTNSIEAAFAYLEQSDMKNTIDELRKLTPKVLKNFQDLYRQNFPNFIRFSPTYSIISNLSVIEIIRDRRLGDYLTLAYIFFPKFPEVGSPLFRVTNLDNSLTRKLTNENLYSKTITESLSGFGHVNIDTEIDGSRLTCNDAWVIKTKFPSRLLLADQTYQLVYYDINSILSSSMHDLHYSEIGQKWINDTSEDISYKFFYSTNGHSHRNSENSH